MSTVGDIYRVRQPFDVTVWLAINAPASLFGFAKPPQNETLIVTDETIYGDVCLRPVDYEALHDHFVSPEERAKVDRGYGEGCYEGYYLLIPQSDLDQYCEKTNRVGAGNL